MPAAVPRGDADRAVAVVAVEVGRVLKLGCGRTRAGASPHPDPVLWPSDAKGTVVASKALGPPSAGARRPDPSTLRAAGGPRGLPQPSPL